MNLARIFLFRFLSFLSQLISGIFANWKLVFLMVIIFSPITLHLRWVYTYQGDSHFKRYTRCTYVGTRGFIPVSPIAGDCPLVILLDTRTGERLL